jgi:hypothetical protein
MRTNKRGSFFVGLLGLSFWFKRFFCSASAALVGPVKNSFFLNIHYFNSFVTIAQQAGKAAMLGRLSLSVCLWLFQWYKPENIRGQGFLVFV